MPLVPSGNTNAPTIMTAWCAADSDLRLRAAGARGNLVRPRGASLGERHPRATLVRLEPRQHVLGEAMHLGQEYFLRHRAAIHVDQDRAGAHRIGLGDDAARDLVRPALRAGLGLDGDVHGHFLQTHAVVMPGAQFFTQMLFRTFLEIAGGLARRDVVEIEQRIVEIDRVRAVFLDRLLFAVGDIGIDHDVEMIGRDPLAAFREAGGIMPDRVLARRTRQAGGDRNVVRHRPVDRDPSEPG